MKTKQEIAAAFRRDLTIGALFLAFVAVLSVFGIRAYDNAQADKDRAVLLGADTELSALRDALATTPRTPGEAIALDDAVNAAENRIGVLIARHGQGPRTYDVVTALAELGTQTESIRMVCTLTVDNCNQQTLAALKADADKAAQAMAGPTRWAAGQAKPASSASRP